MKGDIAPAVAFSTASLVVFCRRNILGYRWLNYGNTQEVFTPDLGKPLRPHTYTHTHAFTIGMASISAQAEEARSREAETRRREEDAARYELQLTALNENLTTLRTDMNTNATRSAELDRAADELRGEKLGKACPHTHTHTH